MSSYINHAALSGAPIHNTEVTMRPVGAAFQPSSVYPRSGGELIPDGNGERPAGEKQLNYF